MITPCVWLCFRFCLSLHDANELMAECGIILIQINSALIKRSKQPALRYRADMGTERVALPFVTRNSTTDVVTVPITGNPEARIDVVTVGKVAIGPIERTLFHRCRVLGCRGDVPPQPYSVVRHGPHATGRPSAAVRP